VDYSSPGQSSRALLPSSGAIPQIPVRSVNIDQINLSSREFISTKINLKSSQNTKKTTQHMVDSSPRLSTSSSSSSLLRKRTKSSSTPTDPIINAASDHHCNQQPSSTPSAMQSYPTGEEKMPLRGAEKGMVRTMSTRSMSQTIVGASSSKKIRTDDGCTLVSSKQK
jgi:hypothetical protein